MFRKQKYLVWITFIKRLMMINEQTKKYTRIRTLSVMGYDVSGTEISERPVRFEGDDFLQFKHRYGRRWAMNRATAGKNEMNPEESCSS